MTCNAAQQNGQIKLIWIHICIVNESVMMVGIDPKGSDAASASELRQLTDTSPKPLGNMNRYQIQSKYCM